MDIRKEIRQQEAKQAYLKALNSLTAVVITPSKGVDKWQVIDGMVADYITVHQEECRQIAEGTKALRATQRNSSASSRDKTMRHALCMPQGLVVLIKQYYPEVFTEKDGVRKLMRKYPGFCVPERI
jgi:hypothetical protein